MTAPVQTKIPQADGSDRYVIIVPDMVQEGGDGFRSTGVFKIYTDVFGDETHWFTEAAELNEVYDKLPDEQNPDYLGKFVFENGSLQHFEGEALSFAEQAYLAVLIETYQKPYELEMRRIPPPLSFKQPDV